MHKKRVDKVDLYEKKHMKNSTRKHEDANRLMLASNPAADITFAANRWELKRAIKTLCERLVTIGEEYFLVTANISSGWVSHFGSLKGRDYIEEQSDIAWNFYRYCHDEESSTDDPEIGVMKVGNMGHSAINLAEPSGSDMDQEFSELMDSDSSSDSKEDDINDGDAHPDISLLNKYSQTMETLSRGLGQGQWDTFDQSEIKIMPLKGELAKTPIMSGSKKSTNRRKRTVVKKYVDANYFDSDVDDDLNNDKEEKMLEIGIKERNPIMSIDFSSKREQEDRVESRTSDRVESRASDHGSREKTQLCGRKRRKQELVRRHWVDSKMEEASDPNE